MKKRFSVNRQETNPPLKSHRFDAGYDLFMPEDIVIRPFETKAIDLKVKVNLAENECGIVCMRSSVAKWGLVAHTSPVDYGYSGSIHLIVTNCSGNTITLNQGERYCQLVIFNIPIESDPDLYNERERS